MHSQPLWTGARPGAVRRQNLWTEMARRVQEILEAGQKLGPSFSPS